MINDDHSRRNQAAFDADSLAPLRGYLLYIAEQYLGPDLCAKGEASDLVQTALLAAYQGRGRFQHRSALEQRGWFRGILLNVVRKFRRRWSAQVRTCTREVSLEECRGRHLAAGDQSSPWQLVYLREQREQLARAVAQLPDEQRSVLVLRVEEGCSFVEIGQRLRKYPDAARMLYNRALGRLRALLEADHIAEASNAEPCPTLRKASDRVVLRRRK
jgi:RNA polymerase sigma-70 factor (ECF subfamily)